MRKVVAIIQARLGSTRLPNKVLLEIPPNSGITCLDRVIERVNRCTLLDDIVLTTPDKILAVNVGIKSKVYYGKRDVLKEFYEAAIAFNADIIVRICADSPLIMPDVIDDMIDTFFDKQVDLVYNTTYGEKGEMVNDGLDVEVMSYEALKIAYQEATTEYDKEHVTPFIRRNMNTYYRQYPPMDVCSLNTYSDYEKICQLWKSNTKLVQVAKK